jgi:very-short-patch-repair endonuclease
MIKIPAPPSEHEEALVLLMRADGIPTPVREYMFARPRQWRADFAWVKERILVEVEGGVWSQGRHLTGSGYTKDCKKYNTASILGWTVLRFTPDMIYDGTAISMLKWALKLP